jgi:hypothetical protein
MAVIGFDEAHGHIECGGLSRSVGSEEADDFSRFHVEGKAVDDGFMPIHFFEISDF